MENEIQRACRDELNGVFIEELKGNFIVFVDDLKVVFREQLNGEYGRVEEGLYSQAKISLLYAKRRQHFFTGERQFF